MDPLAALLHQVDRISLWQLLLLVFLTGLVEVVFPPVPGDTVFLAGGFIAGRRGFPPAAPWAAACLGTFIAAAGLYLVGRLLGPALLARPFFARLLPEDQRGRIRGWFARYGVFTLLFSRFAPVVRSGLALAAGLASMPPGRALAALGGGVLLHNAVLISGGALFEEHWRLLASRLTMLGWTAAFILLAGAVWTMWRRRGRQ
ncbi:MAG: DedA family protein [Bacteroidota bacterium]